eukprot:3599966-Prymnesium_polylepis.1
MRAPLGAESSTSPASEKRRATTVVSAKRARATAGVGCQSGRGWHSRRGYHGGRWVPQQAWVAQRAWVPRRAL